MDVEDGLPPPIRRVAKARYLFAVEAVLIVAGGRYMGFPALIGLVPACLAAVLLAARPSWLPEGLVLRPPLALRAYIHITTAACALLLVVLASLSAYTESNHMAPRDIIIEAGTPHTFFIAYQVVNGVPALHRAGRVEFDIPRSGVLKTQERSVAGWWRPEELRFFVRDGTGLHPVKGEARSNGYVSEGNQACRLEYDQYDYEPLPGGWEFMGLTIEPGFKDWGIDCVGGRLLSR